MKRKFCIKILDPEYSSKAQELSQLLGLQEEICEDPDSNDSDFVFFVGEELSLKANRIAGTTPLTVDFTTGAVDFRRRFGAQGGQMILKAVGGPQKRILDATAGLCRDAFILASCQCDVVAVEKSYALWALVDDALRRARENEKLRNILRRLQFINADAVDFLSDLKPQIFDTIYIDPMFPLREAKTALPKKELRVVQDLVEIPSDDEAEAKIIFEVAEKKAKRIVVKRPLHGPSLTDSRLSPSITYKGSSIRFDVYLF